MAQAPPPKLGLLGGLVVLTLSVFAVLPQFGDGLIATADTLHPWRMYEISRCFDDGQMPCRWLPDLGNGYGMPLYNYYPPLPFHVGELLHVLGFSYVRSMNLLYVVGVAGAGLSMYMLTRRLWGDLGGIVSAVVYMYAPYIALDIYLRGALAEVWALAFAPALLWALYELLTSAKARYVPVVALCFAGLLLSHNLVMVMVAPIVALWVAALLLLRPREAFRPAMLGAAGGLWGLGLAAFFTLPAAFEGSYAALDKLTQWPFDYHFHFASMKDLFLLRTNDYSFLLGGRKTEPIQIGWFHWLIAAVSAPAGAVLFLRGRRIPAIAVLLFAAAFGIGVFMSTSKSTFIYEAFGSLRFIQFPWRYLGLVSLGAAGLAGAWLGVLRDRPFGLQVAVAAALVTLFIGTGWFFFEPVIRYDVTDDDIFHGEFGEFYKRGFVVDFLPAHVDVLPEAPVSRARIVEGQGLVSNPRQGTDWLSFDIEATTRVRIEPAVYEFPNWRVRIDGRVVDHGYQRPYGIITFFVPPGQHHVELRLENTRTRTLANAISMVSWAAMLLTALGMVATPLLARRGIRLPLPAWLNAGARDHLGDHLE